MQTGNGHAVRLVQLADRQLTGSHSLCKGSVSPPARSIVPLRMRSITHRSKPSPEPILHTATKRIRFSDAGNGGGCDDVSATRCTCSSALLQAVSDPKARSALHKKGSNRPSTASLARIGDTAQSVRASDTSNCPSSAMASKFRCSPYTIHR